MHREQALKIVEEILYEYDDLLKPGSYKLTETLDALGLDSLDLVELSLNVEDKLRWEISPQQLDTIKTVEDLVRTLEVFG